MQLVAADASAQDMEKSDIMFYRLGMAAMHGDVKLVGSLDIPEP